MAIFELPYGKTSQTFNLPENLSADWILPNSVKPAPKPEEVIRAALDNAIGFDPKSLETAKEVAIAVNDKTRPVPHSIILPALLTWLEGHGVKPDQIHFWIATGSHKPMLPEEYSKILPDEIIKNFRIDSHNIDDFDGLIQIGTTSRGTPVIVNRIYFEASVKIVVGDIEPHHFAGFSGGYKSAAIGMAGRPTINHNHAMITSPDAWIAEFEANPLRQDIEEIGEMLGVHLALNTILTTEKEIISAVAGRPDQVMKIGIPISRAVCGTHCETLYDTVLASAGGSPKDINFYQAQKALTHASLFAKPGGTLILVAECPEGSGSLAYEEFMRGVSNPQAVFEKFAKMEFQVGPHKAFQVARLLNQFQLVMVSSIPAATVKALLMVPEHSIQDAINHLQASRNGMGSIAILPHATTTIPYRMEANNDHKNRL